MSGSYDIIIVGAGHNGLVTAAYLARAGKRVLVLERRHVVGGACVTEELWPGFKVSTAAYVNSLLRPEIIRDLELSRHGFELLPRSPSSFTPFHHVMGECNGVRGMWGYVRGGMGGITQALASAARVHGAEIRVNSPVAKIVTRRGRVKGVALEDGTEFQAGKVVSNADAHVTFLQLLEERELEPEFVAAVKSIDYASASLKINVALSELPDFTAVRASGLPPNGHLRGTIHVAPTLDYIERAYEI